MQLRITDLLLAIPTISLANQRPDIAFLEIEHLTLDTPQSHATPVRILETKRTAQLSCQGVQ